MTSPLSSASRKEILLSSLKISLTFTFGRLIPNLKLPDVNVSNMNVLVTGANGGIGYEIAKEMYRRGANVTLACRNVAKGQAAIKKIEESVVEKKRGELHILYLDTSSLDSVRDFASQYKAGNQNLDYLFLNAGIAERSKKTPRFNEKALELFYVTNYLGHHLLTNLLQSLFTSEARVILTSSVTAFPAKFSDTFETSSRPYSEELGFHLPYEKGSRPVQKDLAKKGVSGRYAQSKAMQIVFAAELQSRMNKDQRAVSFHPGLAKTAIFEVLKDSGGFWQNPFIHVLSVIRPLLGVSPRSGADTAVWLALTDKEKVAGGGFYERNKLRALPFFRTVNSSKLWNRWNADAGLSESDWEK